MIPLASERPTLSVAAAASALGCSRASLYRAINEGRSPVATIKVNSRVLVITSDLRRVLQLEGDTA